MSHDDLPEDEEWYSEDEDETYDAAEVGHCPECRAPVSKFSDKCPACGYYLTESDRRRIWSSESKPIWVLVTATVILMILLLGMLTLRF